VEFGSRSVSRQKSDGQDVESAHHSLRGISMKQSKTSVSRGGTRVGPGRGGENHRPGSVSRANGARRTFAKRNPASGTGNGREKNEEATFTSSKEMGQIRGPTYSLSC